MYEDIYICVCFMLYTCAYVCIVLHALYVWHVHMYVCAMCVYVLHMCV